MSSTDSYVRRYVADVDNLLYNVFGISPDYQIVWSLDVGGFPSPANLHTVVRDGVTYTAQYMVVHASKRVYLKVLQIDGNKYSRTVSCCCHNCNQNP